MAKIAIIGAGSEFTQKILADLLRIEALEEAVVALIDIDARRLHLVHRLVERMVEARGRKWVVESSTDRKQLLAGTHFVIHQIEVNGVSTIRSEYEIPLKYGVKPSIGDTMGPGGLFKTIRTVPEWLAILTDIERLCPDALVLNYTNPMSAVTLAASKFTGLKVVGLCHSITNTSHLLAEYAGVPYEELQWECGGINHMAWFTQLKHKGKDLYPLLKKKTEEEAFLRRDHVRFDTMNHFGYFSSESSGHYSEYVPYYRKRQDLIDRYIPAGSNGETGFYATRWAAWRDESDRHIERVLAGEAELGFAEGAEYAPIIIEGVLGSEPKVIYGNVPNRGLIDNLPADGIVEVKCVVDRSGVSACRFGKLPEHLATLNRSNMSFFELAVTAVLERDREMAMHALMVDPLTAAVCSLDEIKRMFDELMEADKDYIVELK